MTEQQPYELVRRLGDVELRRYPAHVVAEVAVAGPFGRAANAGFRPLFEYITGKNAARRSLAMTAPVVQHPPRTARRPSQQVPMTAPVLQRGPLPGGEAPDGETVPASYVVAFVLPAGMTEDTAPIPADPRVHLRTVPASTAAALPFSGSGSAAAFARYDRQLQEALEAARLTPLGAPRFARFDPPFKPWFLRRNEVVQDVLEDGTPDVPSQRSPH